VKALAAAVVGESWTRAHRLAPTDPVRLLARVLTNAVGVLTVAELGACTARVVRELGTAGVPA
jgi:hypothetical protein